MNIFESLENLEISEACFNEIMDIVERFLGIDYIYKKQNTADRLLDKVPMVNGEPDKNSKEWQDYIDAANNLSNAEGIVKHAQDYRIAKNNKTIYNPASDEYRKKAALGARIRKSMGDEK